jgi:hypothetical protein
MEGWEMRLFLMLASAAWGAFVGVLVERRYARPRCHHVFSGRRELVRHAWVRHCESCGHAEVSSGPIPQPPPRNP